MSDSSVIPGLGTRDDQLAPTPVAQRAALSKEEKDVLAAMGRVASLGEVIRRSPMPEAKTIATLLSLRARGCIAPARVAGAAAGPKAASKAIDDQALNENVDLPKPFMKEVLETEATMGSANHFEVLGLAAGASHDEVKRAYHELSKRYHPDRYYGKNLGSFKGRIERVFKRLTEANVVLSSREKREEYLTANPSLRAAISAKAEQGHDKVRENERRARLARHPYLGRATRSATLVSEAKELLKNKQFTLAINKLTEATQVDPNHREAAQLLKDARKQADGYRIEVELGRGRDAERQQRFDMALECYRSALQMDPQCSEAAYRLALLLTKLGREPKEALHSALKAFDIDPSVEHRLLLGELMAEHGDKKAAKHHLEEVLKAQPENQRAKKAMGKLRWPFGR